MTDEKKTTPTGRRRVIVIDEGGLYPWQRRVKDFHDGQKIVAEHRTSIGKSFFAVDYSKIEERILAWDAHDPDLVSVVDLCHYYDTSDVHRARAAHEFGVAAADVTEEMRRAAKKLNFWYLYDSRKRTLP